MAWVEPIFTNISSNACCTFFFEIDGLAELCWLIAPKCFSTFAEERHEQLRAHWSTAVREEKCCASRWVGGWADTVRTTRQREIRLKALELVIAPTRSDVTSTELHQRLNVVDELIIARIGRASVVICNNSRDARSLAQNVQLLVLQLSLVSASGVDSVHVTTSYCTVHMGCVWISSAT